MSQRRRELIREALERRLHEVRSERIARLVPDDYGPRAALVRGLQAQISNTESLAFVTQLQATQSGNWMECEEDCLEALIKLSLGEKLALQGTVDAPLVEPFIAELLASRREPDKHFELLVERYSCPLNIALDSESDVREHLLETLMVRDRARIEKGSEAIDACEDVLLKLNLLAVYAAASSDLRYLDALNYYYEILPERCTRGAGVPWLYVSYLGLYTRALSSWLERKFSE